MAPGGECLLRVFGMRVRIGVDRDGIGTGRREGRTEVGKLRIVGTDGGEQIATRGLATGDYAHDLEVGQRVVGLGVRFAHVTAADDENPDAFLHGLLQRENGALHARAGKPSLSVNS